MPASEYLAPRAVRIPPIRLALDANSHLAGVLRGVVFGLALLAPVVATAFGPAVHRPFKSEATQPLCPPAGTTAGRSPAPCTPR